jgi:mono/diheme cytochrome c family protein
VLERVDKAVAIISWLVAAALLLMLLVGPQVVAEDESKPKDEAAGSAPYASGSGGGGGATDGKAVFSENCGSCHTLQAAGTSGQVGPRLDGTSLSDGEIQSIVREGRGSMPAFGGRLSDAEVASVAAFVAGSR